MDFSDGVADLHLHTTASDGTSSVGERVTQAIEYGLDAIAITDHDCIAEGLDGRVSRRDGVELITGVEVRGGARDTKIELLGYYVDPDNDPLNEVLTRARYYRKERNRKMISNLVDVIGVDFSYQSLRDNVDEMLGRPHMAAALVDAGVVDSISAAFDAYLGADGDAYVPMERIPANELVTAIQDAGGVASLAHPGRIRSNEVSNIVADLVDAGLDAVEVWYPYDEAPNEGYSGVGVPEAKALAEEYSLLCTGGSDCHGPDSGKFRIGEVRVPDIHFAALRDRADERRTL